MPARAIEYNNIVPGANLKGPFKRRRDVAKKSGGTVPQKIITVSGGFKWRVARRGSHLPFQISTFQFLRSTFNVQPSHSLLYRAFFFCLLPSSVNRSDQTTFGIMVNVRFFLPESVRMSLYDPMTASATKLPTSSRLSFTFRILPPFYTIILHDRNMSSTVAAHTALGCISPLSGRPSSLSPDPASHFHADHTLPESA